MPRSVVLVDGVRTPYCRANTDLRDLSAADLGRAALVELFARTGFDPAHLDEVIFGNIATPADSANIARVIALRSGVPRSVPAFTVGRNCGSGAESIADGFLRIQAGLNEAVAAGGVESMSQIPLLFSEQAKRKFFALFGAKSAGARLGALLRFRPSDFRPVVGLELGLTDPICDLNMGQTAEILAKEFHITREEPGRLRPAIAPARVRCPLEARRGNRSRPDSSRLRPARRPGQRHPRKSDPGSAREAEALLRPEIRNRDRRKLLPDHRRRSCHARDVRRGSPGPRAQADRPNPLFRVRRHRPGADGPRARRRDALALKRAGVAWKDVGLLEINEAFAAQVLACARAWSSADWAKKNGLDGPIGEFDFDRTNVNGGAIALGHPVGSSGTRLVLTLLKEMRRRSVALGVATMCIGGGQGGAVVVEAI